MTTIDTLIKGALYELPNGHRVVAEQYLGGKLWFLRCRPEAQQVYALDVQGAIRLISYRDQTGEVKGVRGEDGQGALTDFTVGDLQPV